MTDIAKVFVAEVIADGRITIPSTIRKLFGIEDGDFVRLQLKGKVNAKRRTTELG